MFACTPLGAAGRALRSTLRAWIAYSSSGDCSLPALTRALIGNRRGMVASWQGWRWRILFPFQPSTEHPHFAAHRSIVAWVTIARNLVAAELQDLRVYLLLTRYLKYGEIFDLKNQEGLERVEKVEKKLKKRKSLFFKDFFYFRKFQRELSFNCKKLLLT